MKTLWVAALIAAALAGGTARAQDPGVLNVTVEHVWSGIAPCLAKAALSDDEIADRLVEVSRGAPAVDAEVNGVAFTAQPRVLVVAFRQITRLASRETLAGRVPADCHDVLCASRAIFGDEAGPRLLLIAAAYHFNASSLGERTNDAWDAEDLDRLIAAFDDLPKGLFPLSGEYRALVRRDDESWWTPASGQAFQIVARSGERAPGIVVEAGWARVGELERRVVLVHELAHEFARAQARGWRTAWQDAVQADAEAAANTNLPSVPSAYARRGLDEDFAESVAAYRYIAPLLKRRAPHRYALLKDWMFKGAEYGSARACRGY
jgi:hypothetical protein